MSERELLSTHFDIIGNYIKRQEKYFKENENWPSNCLSVDTAGVVAVVVVEVIQHGNYNCRRKFASTTVHMIEEERPN